MPCFSVFANDRHMTELEADTKLINDLCAFAKKRPSRIAADLGMAATTLTRPANGKAKTRIGRGTLEQLRAAYPTFPGFTGEERPEGNAVPVPMEGASLEKMRENMPIYGTALGASRKVDGDAIEQTTLNRGEIVHYAKRPVLLNGRQDAYGLYVQGSSMYPAHPDGSMVVVAPNMPIRVGDDVIVYLRPTDPEDDDGVTARAVLLKRLVKRNGSFMELEQFTPPKIFRIGMDEIVRCDRVITVTEMLT